MRRGNFLFMLVFLVLSTLGFLVQSLNFLVGVFITEWIIILGITLAYSHLIGFSFKETFLLRPVPPRMVAKALGIGFFGYLWAAVLGALISFFASIFNIQTPVLPIPVPRGWLEWVLAFLGISISAGISEELMFRGFILNSFREIGTARAIATSALLFALMHGSFFRFIPIFFLGLVYGYMAWRTGSILPTILAHALNNAFSLALTGIVPNLAKSPNASNTSALALAGFVLLFLFSISVVGLPLLLKGLPRGEGVEFIPSQGPLSLYLKGLLGNIPFLVGLLLFFVLGTVEFMGAQGWLPRWPG